MLKVGLFMEEIEGFAYWKGYMADMVPIGNCIRFTSFDMKHVFYIHITTNNGHKVFVTDGLVHECVESASVGEVYDGIKAAFLRNFKGEKK